MTEIPFASQASLAGTAPCAVIVILAMSSDGVAAHSGPAALPPAIFVLGTRPAFTSLVGAMLGRNPAAFAFPHLNLFASDTLEGVVTATASAGQTIHGLLRAVAYIYGGEQTLISIAMARRWLRRRLSCSTGEVFDELRTHVAPQRLVDKSAIYSQDTTCLARILRIAPDSFFVHVVEHPLTPGAVSGLFSPRGRGRRARTDNSHDQMQWLEAQRRISEALKIVVPGRLAIVRMEDLLADPPTAISGLCARLDLPSNEISMAEMLHPENSPFAGPGPVGANLGDVPAFLQDPTFPPKRIAGNLIEVERKEIMLPEIAEFAARYGYD